MDCIDPQSNLDTLRQNGKDTWGGDIGAYLTCDRLPDKQQEGVASEKESKRCFEIASDCISSKKVQRIGLVQV